MIEHGGTEDQAIAGLLHDVIEDCGEAHEAVIREQFGDTVARIVRACTDGTAEGKGAHATPEPKKADWLRRKQEYLKHLAEEGDEVLLVSGCDKLHNALERKYSIGSPSVPCLMARPTGRTRNSPIPAGLTLEHVQCPGPGKGGNSWTPRSGATPCGSRRSWQDD